MVHKTRPRNRPFTAAERRYLAGLDAIDSCTEKRITWNRYFAEHASRMLDHGARPADIFRAAGAGPERIGSKRIERCAARWRRQARKEREQ